MITTEHLLVCVLSSITDEERLDHINSGFGLDLSLNFFGAKQYLKDAVAWDISCFWKQQVPEGLTDENLTQIISLLDPNKFKIFMTDDPQTTLSDNGFVISTDGLQIVEGQPGL